MTLNEFLSTLSSISSDSNLKKSYSEFVSSCQTRWEKLMTVVASSVDSDHDMTNIVNEISAAGLEPGQLVCLNDGYETIANLCTKVHDASVLSDTADTLNDQVVQLKSNINSVGDTATVMVDTTLDNILTNINEVYHSVVVQFGVVKAYALEAEGKITDKLASMRDTVQSYFTSAYSDVSGYLEKAVSTLQSNCDFGSYIKQFMKDSGINDCANGSELSESSDATFTGASPASAYSLSGVVSTAATVGKVVWNGLKGMYNWLIDKLSTAAVNAKQFAYQTAVNPYDAYVCNKTALSPTFVRYCFQSTSTYPEGTSMFHATLAENPVFMGSYYGDVLLSDVGDDTTFRLQMKPKPMKVDIYYPALISLRGHDTGASSSSITVPIDEVASWFGSFSGQVQMYESAEASGENTLFAGFILGETMLYVAQQFMNAFGNAQANVTLDKSFFNGRLTDVLAAIDYSSENEAYTNIITNEDWYNLVAANTSRPMVLMPTVYARAFELAFEQAAGTEYVFMPYTHNTASWDDGMYDIKSDQQNTARFNLIVSAIAIVVLVVVAAIATKKAIKSAYWKAQLNCDRANWDASDTSHPLSKADIKRVRKATKRLNRVSKLMDGTQSAVSSGMSTLLSSATGTVTGGTTGATVDQVVTMIGLNAE